MLILGVKNNSKRFSLSFLDIRDIFMAYEYDGVKSFTVYR